jgi:hypothetical protein
MKLWKQTCLIAAIILAAIFLILAGADAGMNPVGPQRCVFEIPVWFGCLLANHEGLAGGLFGGGGALFSAWIAWRAVMGQITAKEDATYEAIKIELDRVADVVAMIWRVVDAVLLPRRREDRETWRENGRAVLLAIYPGSGSLIEKLDNDLAKDLDPIRRKEFTRVVESLKWLCDMIEKRDEERLWFENLRTMLTHFNNYVHQFDPRVGKKFKDRTKGNIDHRSYAAHLEPTVSQFEATGNLQP